jgi:hypothetical protein
MAKHEKPARSWAVHLIRKRMRYVGTVEAADPESAEAEAVRVFNLSAEDRAPARAFNLALGRACIRGQEYDGR